MKIFGHGVLGMNARNLKYIRTKNVGESVSLADSKLKTKNFLSVRGIPFAETYASISSHMELEEFSFNALRENAFVIKPNHGSKGKGILIVKKNKNGTFTIDGENWSEERLRLHMLDTINGAFSLYGNHDKAVVEELLRPGREFSKFCRYGLADIRIIVYNYVPITAMVRMPTEASGGKANLAQGGIGLGLNIANGEVMSFFENKKIFKGQFPLGYEYLKGAILPFWDNILLYSSQIQFYTGLGYLALDWVITKNGPKLLELNARAGLEIQNVNLVPLAKRLKQVDNLLIKSPEKGVEIAKSLFHSDVSNAVIGKKIIHFSQFATVRGVEILLRVDPNIAETKISTDLKKRITDNTIIFLKNGVQLIVSPKGGCLENGEKNTVILGQNDLKDCLISPILVTSTNNNMEEKYSAHIRMIDEKLYILSRKLNISATLKPQNYSEQLHYFLKNPHEYNPHFEYNFPSDEKIAEINIGLQDLQEEIAILQKTHEIFASLFAEKLQELLDRKGLVLAYKMSDYKNILHYNERLFGKFNENLLALASEKTFRASYQTQRNEKTLGKILSLDEIVIAIEEYLKKYNIFDVHVQISDTTFSRMAVAYKKNSVHVNISVNAKIREKELPAILAHELGVHLRRYLNGKKAGLKIFETGVGYYLSDEEGLAVYNSLQYMPEGIEKNAMYENYYRCFKADTLSFSELAAFLRSSHPERSWEKIFSSTSRLKRGIKDTSVSGFGGISYQKDKIYLDGYFHVKEWIDSGGDIEKMYFGKIKISDLPIIDNL